MLTRLLFISFSLIFYMNSYAGTCVTYGADETCLTKRNAQTVFEKKFHSLSGYSEDVLISEPFRLKKSVEAPTESKIQISKNDQWQMTLSGVEYLGEAKNINAQDLVLSVVKNDKFFEPDWVVNKTISLNTKRVDKEGYGEPFNIYLKLKEKTYGKLGHGDHQIVVYFRVYDSYTGVTQNVKFVSDFHIPKWVAIWGLGNINLGVYPDHRQTGTSDFCVYANGRWGYGGKFKIQVEGKNNRGSGKLNLKHTQKNAYIPYSAHIAKKNSDHFYSLDGSVQSLPLRGSLDTYCWGGKNMILKVELIEFGAPLGSKIAGTYKDTLTLIVSPEE